MFRFYIQLSLIGALLFASPCYAGMVIGSGDVCATQSVQVEQTAYEESQSIQLNKQLAQQITATDDGTLYSVVLRLNTNRLASGSDVVTMRLKASSNDLSSGYVQTTSTVTFGQAAGEVEFVFAPADRIAIANGTVYTVAISSGIDYDHRCEWSNSNLSSYAGGLLYYNAAMDYVFTTSYATKDLYSILKVCP